MGSGILYLFYFRFFRSYKANFNASFLCYITGKSNYQFDDIRLKILISSLIG